MSQPRRVILAAVVALCAADQLVRFTPPAFAEQERSRTGDAGGGGGDTLDQGDFTSLGSGRIPSTFTASWGSNMDTYRGEGFTLKYEPGDSGNLHFLAFAYSFNQRYEAMTCAECNTYPLYQSRVPTLSLPRSPLVWDNYSTASATGRVTYPATSAGYRAKRLVYDTTVSKYVPMEDMLTGRIGIHWDGTDRAYVTYNYGYTQVCTDYSMMYIKPNYGSPSSSTSRGPWYWNNAGPKATANWASKVPASLRALIAGGSGLTMAVGSGIIFSNAGACDVSLGPSAELFAPPADGTAELTGLNSTSVVGYWPSTTRPDASHGRMNRGRDYVLPLAFFPNLAADDVYWGPAKQTTKDHTRACVLVDTGTKSGLVCLVEQGEGQCNYNQSTTSCEWYSDWFVIYSFADLAAVANGTLARYSLQPTHRWEVTWPFINYRLAPNTPVVHGNIVSITATAGADVAGDGCPGACVDARMPLVTLDAPHSLSAGQFVSLRGTSADGQYGGVFTVQSAPSSTTLRIKSPNMGVDVDWSGASATGGVARGAVSAGTNSATIHGIDYDATTKRIWVKKGAYNVGAGYDGTAFLTAFQLR